MKTNYKDFAKRFELAEREVWAETDKTRQKMILAAKASGKENDAILSEFTKRVIQKAEDESHKFNENLPPVPKATLEQEPIRINC
jgi:hypothetical protein